MGQITSGIGLVSGINSKDIIDQLMSLEERPKTLLQTRKDKLSKQSEAYTAISTSVTTLTTTARTFQRPSTFTASTATSSNEDVLTASTSAGAAVGSYQFQVARMVTSQQSVTAGFANADAPLKAGNLTIEMGGGNLATQTSLASLNGGEGVSRGLFRITDRAGNASAIDISDAVTLDDVVRKINTSLEISVKASIDGDRLVLKDATGSTANNLTVVDLADGHAAEDLGIVQSVAADTLTGEDINHLGLDTPLSLLNDGLGVRKATAGPDLVITARDGSTINVTLGANARSVGDVIEAINTAAGGKVTASVQPGSNGIRLTAGTGGGTALKVANGANSKAASDLGLAKTGSTTQLNGDPAIAGMNTVLVKNLKGGAGLALGTISITDRSGDQANVNLAGATTVAEILKRINDASGFNVTASLNAAGNGIQIVDDSGGAGDLIIGESGGGSTAADLGLAGTFNAATKVARGVNLQHKWVSENTLLTSFNGGKGVTPGSFKITNSAGGQSTINLTDGKATTLGDVITRINAANAGVTASVNANGDGLLLTDTKGGGGKLKVENVTGTTARDLNIFGEAADPGAGIIDGAWEKTIAVSATDTLNTISRKIREAGFGVASNVINDGSGINPHRLSLTAFNTGIAGRVIIDGGATGLDATTLVAAQDAAVFVGGTGAAEPLLVTSSTNQLTNIIAGVNIDIHGVSDKPVTLNIARDPSKVVDEVKKFVDAFNEITEAVAVLTKYDVEKQQAGLLLGESAIQRVTTEMYLSIQGVVKGAGQFAILADIGVTIGDGAKLAFDEEKFKAAIGKDPEAVKNLFSMAATGLSATTTLASLNDGKGVRTAGGQPDFRLALKDETNLDITVPAGGTLNDVIAAINTAAAGKATVAINDRGDGLNVTDNTTGGGAFSITSLNGSAAVLDLGLNGAWPTGVASGKQIFTDRRLQTGGGFGYLIERKLNLLVDPVDGVLTREKKTIQEKTTQYDKRMSDIDRLVASKRARLERQFANMESVLAGLQSQQTSLASLNTNYFQTE